MIRGKGRREIRNTLDTGMKPEYSASHSESSTETGRFVASFGIMTPNSEINVPDSRPCGDEGLLDLVNDPFFLGKASALDHLLLVKLKRYEILFRERRAQLEQLLGPESTTIQDFMQVSPLSTALVYRATDSKPEIME